jgi:hypothetical protein
MIRSPVAVVAVAAISWTGTMCSRGTGSGAATPSSSKGPAWQPLTEPITRVGVKKVGEKLVFELGLCGEESSGIPTSRLEVVGDNRILCKAEEKEGVVAPFVTRWEYGTAPSGFEVTKCQPLEVGHRYSVCSIGGGGGCSDFELDAQGEPRLTKDDCGNRQH